MKSTSTEIAFTLPIVYHVSLRGGFDVWASECGCTEEMLQETGERSIRTRHHEAEVRHGDEAIGNRPAILTLSLGLPRSACIHYSVEPDVILIRGYSWDIGREPLDLFDGGGFYCDYRHPGEPG